MVSGNWNAIDPSDNMTLNMKVMAWMNNKIITIHARAC